MEGHMFPETTNLLTKTNLLRAEDKKVHVLWTSEERSTFSSSRKLKLTLLWCLTVYYWFCFCSEFRQMPIIDLLRQVGVCVLSYFFRVYEPQKSEIDLYFCWEQASVYFWCLTMCYCFGFCSKFCNFPVVREVHMCFILCIAPCWNSRDVSSDIMF